MISHKDCEHPSTPSARAKCRRAQAKGEDGATVKEVNFTGVSQKKASVDKYGQTPRDRDKQCQNCGVERILYRGTDPLSGLLLFVGERCEYMVRRSPDRQEVLD